MPNYKLSECGIPTVRVASEIRVETEFHLKSKQYGSPSVVDLIRLQILARRWEINMWLAKPSQEIDRYRTLCHETRNQLTLLEPVVFIESELCEGFSTSLLKSDLMPLQTHKTQQGTNAASTRYDSLLDQNKPHSRNMQDLQGQIQP
jgi:hypothetical protein